MVPSFEIEIKDGCQFPKKVKSKLFSGNSILRKKDPFRKEWVSTESLLELRTKSSKKKTHKNTNIVLKFFFKYNLTYMCGYV